MKYPIEIETEAAFKKECDESIEAAQQQDIKRFAHAARFTSSVKSMQILPSRPWWKRLLFWLPAIVLLLLSGAKMYAPTYVTDQTGRVVTTLPWPYDHDVVAPMFMPNILKELSWWRSTPSTPAPTWTTPTPTKPL